MQRALIGFAVLSGWAFTHLTPKIGTFISFRAATTNELPYFLSETRDTDMRSSPLALLLVVAIALIARREDHRVVAGDREGSRDVRNRRATARCERGGVS